MTMETTPASIHEAIQSDGRYPPAAFEFLFRGLERAAKRVHGERKAREARHVTGQQLCEGLRLEAIANWGLLAPTVLQRWRIRRTRDFGEMVMLLIGLEVFARQDSDRIEDFDDVYDFAAAFSNLTLAIDEESLAG